MAESLLVLMSLLRGFGSFLGALLKAVLPTVLQELRKPREGKMTGGDKDLAADIDANIERELDADDTKWWSGRCKCSACQHKWVGVIPGLDGGAIPSQMLECPSCHKMTGLADPEEL